MAAVGGPSDWNAPTGCVSGGSSETYVMSDCVAGPLPAAPPPPPKDEKPPVCPRPDVSSTPSAAGFNGIGDPVDLTTGQLQQTVVDLDVGDGLRFVRHYASNLDRSGAATTTAGPMGYNWIHNFQWSLQYFHDPTGTADFYLVRRPLKTAVPFVRLEPTGGFITAAGDGKLDVDGTGVVTFTDADGTIARFDSSYQLIEIRPLGETPIQVTYGSNTQIFTRGAYSPHHYLHHPVRPRYVSTVSGGGETISYGYITASYSNNTVTLLRTVTVPDHSSPPNTLDWTYGYHTYDGQYGPGLLTSVTRQGTATPIGQWGWTYYSSGNTTRVSSVDERDLEQPLVLSYATEPVMCW